jgi:hypothetical protein
MHPRTSVCTSPARRQAQAMRRSGVHRPAPLRPAPAGSRRASSSCDYIMRPRWPSTQPHPAKQPDQMGRHCYTADDAPSPTPHLRCAPRGATGCHAPTKAACRVALPPEPRLDTWLRDSDRSGRALGSLAPWLCPHVGGFAPCPQSSAQGSPQGAGRPLGPLCSFYLLANLHPCLWSWAVAFIPGRGPARRP